MGGICSKPPPSVNIDEHSDGQSHSNSNSNSNGQAHYGGVVDAKSVAKRDMEKGAPSNRTQTTASSSSRSWAVESAPASKRNRRSLFRVNSRKYSRSIIRTMANDSERDDETSSPDTLASPIPHPPPHNTSLLPGSPRARASTYSHVHDAVMYNLSEAEQEKHDQAVPMGVIGIRNLGNTCFINSSLQCLSATIPLTDYFLGYDYRSEINHDNFLGTRGKLAMAYAELMKQMWLGNGSVVDPTEFKQQLGTFAPQFSGYAQHDTQEVLAFLLDGIHEDLNRVDTKTRPYIEDKDCDGSRDEADAIDAWKNYLQRNKSLIVDLFQGQLKSTCKCLTCGHKNIRFEPFMYLSLPLSRKTKSLQDCLDLYLGTETLKGDDQWYCGKCKKHVDARKQTDLWILPPILIVHLKRFSYGNGGMLRGAKKNDAPIEYPVTEWDLSGHVGGAASKHNSMYDLYAVSNHMGTHGGGHYTAHTLNRFDDVWYEMNDSRYRSVDPDVHRQKSQASSAYVLYYNRSEGDASQPLNERSPIIRRQSVSRPELWPHQQNGGATVARDSVRAFSRTSNRRLMDDSAHNLSNTNININGGSGSGVSTSHLRSSTDTKQRPPRRRRARSASPGNMSSSDDSTAPPRRPLSSSLPSSSNRRPNGAHRQQRLQRRRSRRIEQRQRKKDPPAAVSSPNR